MPKTINKQAHALFVWPGTYQDKDIAVYIRSMGNRRQQNFLKYALEVLFWPK